MASVGELSKSYRRTDKQTPSTYNRKQFFDEDSDSRDHSAKRSQGSRSSDEQEDLENHSDNERHFELKLQKLLRSSVLLNRVKKRKSRMIVKGRKTTMGSDDEQGSSQKIMQSDSENNCGSSSSKSTQKSQKPVGVGNQISQAPTTLPYGSGTTPTANAQHQMSTPVISHSTLSQSTIQIPHSRTQHLFGRNSKLIIVWDFVILCCIFLDVFLIPLIVCQQEVQQISSLSFLLLNVVQSIYLADIYVSFNTTYFDRQVKEVTNLSKVRLKYFESSFFFLDIVSCSPILMFKKIYFTAKGFNQLILLIRLLKAAKLKKILISLHQRFHISNKLYFLGYLASVLAIVPRVNASFTSKHAFGIPSQCFVT
jgi:hypothetical protein